MRSKLSISVLLVALIFAISCGGGGEGKKKKDDGPAMRVTEVRTSSKSVAFLDHFLTMAYAGAETSYLTAIYNESNQVKRVEPIQNPYSAAMLEKYIDNKVERSYFFVKDYAVYYFSTDDPALFAEIEKWAADELRSVNAQVEYVLRDAVRRRRGDRAAGAGSAAGGHDTAAPGEHTGRRSG